jgi:hypothetical protein
MSMPVVISMFETAETSHVDDFFINFCVIDNFIKYALLNFESTVLGVH